MSHHFVLSESADSMGCLNIVGYDMEGDRKQLRVESIHVE